MPSKILNMICRDSNNLLVVAAVTLFCPEYFIKKNMGDGVNGSLYWEEKKCCLTISFDCDYSRDVKAIPAVLKILKSFDIKTSFACVGYWIEHFPEEHKMILEFGHEILNHTYSHPDNDELTPGRKFRYITYDEKKSEISKCHDTCRRILDYTPIGCRIPHFKKLLTKDIYKILRELNYKYSSSTLLTSTKSHGYPFLTEEGIVEFPLSTCPKHPFTVFDTWHSFNSRRIFYKLIHNTQVQYLDLFKNLIDIGIENRAYVNVYIDPYDLLKMDNFGEVLKYIKEKEEDIWVARYVDILENSRWLKK